MLHKQVCEVVDAHWNGIPEKPEIRDADGWKIQSARAAIKGRKSDRVLLLTLTVRNPKADELSDTIKKMSKAWMRLSDDDRVKGSVKGWFRALEVTYNAKDDTYHPHYHVLLMVRGDYFDTRKTHYIPQEEWQQIWQRVLDVDYLPSVDIRSVNGKAGSKLTEETKKALHESTKYATKPQNMYKLFPDGATVPEHIVKTLHDALKGKRLVGWGGTFKQLRAELALPDVESPNTDLTDKCEIPAGTEPVAVHVYRWFMGPTHRPDYYLRTLKEQKAA